MTVDSAQLQAFTAQYMSNLGVICGVSFVMGLLSGGLIYVLAGWASDFLEPYAFAVYRKFACRRCAHADSCDQSKESCSGFKRKER